MENPLHLDTSADPETVYGPEVATRDDAEVFGSRGYAIRYADGTIEVFAEGSTGPVTYRPQPGGVKAYEFYDEHGDKFENLIIAIDPDEVFGPTPP